VRAVRVLVTGSSGFIGRATCRWLGRHGHTVLRAQRTPAPGALALDLEHPDSALFDARPDVILHLAWGHADNQHRDDPYHFAVNLRFSEWLAEEAAARGVPLIGVGSQAEYGPAGVVLTPQTPCHPITAYGAAKLRAGERFAERGAWIRVLTAYGPGDDPRKLLPYLAATFRRGERAVTSPGAQRWDWLHVEDAAAALGRAVETRLTGLHVLAAEELCSIADLTRALWSEARRRGFAPPEPEIGGRPYNPNELFLLAGDSTSFRSATGWAPTVPLAAGLSTLFDEEPG
jgi:nucleoside-diphosphate-sugar epimerase